MMKWRLIIFTLLVFSLFACGEEPRPDDDPGVSFQVIPELCELRYQLGISGYPEPVCTVAGDSSEIAAILQDAYRDLENHRDRLQKTGEPDVFELMSRYPDRHILLYRLSVNPAFTVDKYIMTFIMVDDSVFGWRKAFSAAASGPEEAEVQLKEMTIIQPDAGQMQTLTAMEREEDLRFFGGGQSVVFDGDRYSLEIAEKGPAQAAGFYKKLSYNSPGGGYKRFCDSLVAVAGFTGYF